MQEDSELNAPLTARAATILKGEYACHEFGCIVPVFALMLVGPFEGESTLQLDSDDDSALLRRLQELPPELAAAISKASQGNYRPDFSRTIAETY